MFYRKLNQLLASGGFDRWIEGLCEPHYCQGQGRPSVPPGQYFRMLRVGYFEGINSQRGIAWRCSDSLSLREFLGIPLGEDSPDHSSLSYIRNRLPHSVHEAVFVGVLALAQEQKLLKGKTVAVDSTTLEANAAMKSIVRKDTGEDWKEYLTRLMKEAGLIEDDDDPPSDDALRKFDKARQNKKVSNDEWTSPNDPDSRIARMKDGTTHLAYKAEHVVDLGTEVILAAEIYHADYHDAVSAESVSKPSSISTAVASRRFSVVDELLWADSRILRTGAKRAKRLSANLLAGPPILFHNLQTVPAIVPKGDNPGDSGLSPAKSDKKSLLNSLPAKDLGG